VLKLLANRLEVLKITRDITEQTQSALGERQREAVLREQLRQLQKELGDDGDSSVEIDELEKSIEKAAMPTEVAEHARKELKRLQRMNEASRSTGWCEAISTGSLRFRGRLLTSRTSILSERRRILDEDHYGLDKVKAPDSRVSRRAQAEPSRSQPDPVLSSDLPAWARTSLGQSIARALGFEVPAGRAWAVCTTKRKFATSADLHRRAPRQHHPGSEEGRYTQSGVHAG